MTTPLDPSKFAAAKFRFMLGVGLDAELPKLSLRIASLFVGRHMKADRGGEAWPAVRTLCAELGISSDRAVREALYALLERGHLVADRKSGARTRYRVAERYFEGDTQAHDEPELDDTQAHDEPGTQAEIEPAPQAHDEPPPQAHDEPTSSGKIALGFELRELNSGKWEREAQTRESDLFAGESVRPAARKRRSQASPVSSPASDEAFASFWSAYPRHVGKAAARKAFDRAVKGGARPEDLALAAMRFGAERELAEPDPAIRERFTPHAATGLIGGRWTDAPAARAAAAARPLSAARAQRRPSAIEIALAMNAAEADGASCQ